MFCVNSDEDVPGPVGFGSGDELTKGLKMDEKQPRWRKKFLPAGLFSDYYKQDE